MAVLSQFYNNGQKKTKDGESKWAVNAMWFDPVDMCFGGFLNHQADVLNGGHVGWARILRMIYDFQKCFVPSLWIKLWFFMSL